MKFSEKKFSVLFQDAFGAENPAVKTGPGFGVDCSLISLNGQMDMLCASDPLSYIPALGPQLSAYLSVHLLANDLATGGKAPQFFQMVLNLPENMDQETFRVYWDAIHLECKKINMAITGGHTGWVFGQNSTVSGGGTMFSTGKKNSFLTADQAKPGNAIVLTKQAAIAATSILGLHFPEKMKTIFGSDEKEYFTQLFYNISSLKEGVLAGEFNRKNKRIHALHDVTEGGVINAVYEFAAASSLGCEIDLGKIPVDDKQWKVCEAFNLSPFEIVGAGAMLASVEEEFAEAFINFLKAHQIPVQIIGSFTEKNGPRQFTDLNNNKIELQPVETDPYWQAFAQALKK